MNTLEYIKQEADKIRIAKEQEINKLEQEQIARFEKMKESNPKIDFKEDESPTTDAVKGFALGVVEGATFGFGDEIVGGGSAVANIVHQGLGKLGITEEPKMSVSEAYKLGRDKARGIKKEAEEKAPIASTVGEVVGGVAGSIATGGGSSVSNIIAKGAAEGATYGLGKSEAEDVEGAIKDTVLGGAIGGFGGAIGSAVTKGVGKVIEKAPRVVGKYGHKISDKPVTIETEGSTFITYAPDGGPKLIRGRDVYALSPLDVYERRITDKALDEGFRKGAVTQEGKALLGWDKYIKEEAERRVARIPNLGQKEREELLGIQRKAVESEIDQLTKITSQTDKGITFGDVMTGALGYSIVGGMAGLGLAWIRRMLQSPDNTIRLFRMAKAMNPDNFNDIVNVLIQQSPSKIATLQALKEFNNETNNEPKIDFIPD